MAILRRTRGALLRLVRRRALSMSIGAALAIPCAVLQVHGPEIWWVEGLSLVVGATGLALFWTGLTGPSPDWIDDSGP